MKHPDPDLHVLGSSSVHHQEFFTLHTTMTYVIQFCRQLLSRIRMEHPDPAQELSTNLYDIRHCCVYSEKNWGTRWRSWLRHCATSRKVAVSIPDGVTGIFHWHNPSGRTTVLRLTQPLTEMSTRNISWG